MEIQKHINFELYSPVKHWHHQNQWMKSHSVFLYISFIDFIHSSCQNTSKGHVNKIYTYENMFSNYIFGNILVRKYTILWLLVFKWSVNDKEATCDLQSTCGPLENLRKK